MMRFAGLLIVLAAVATAVPAAAQSPTPRPTGAMGIRRVPISLQNPANRKNNPGVMGGQGCISGPTSVRAQTTAINPVNGQAQAAPIISIPLTKGGGDVASATTRAQQAHACAHPTH
jgi:hypothetical protein